MAKLNVSVKEFSITPGSRHRDEGDFSGEEFREKILVPLYQRARNENKKLIVNLDGTIGFGTSWLEEAFGGLAREFNKVEVLATLEFISDEEPYLIGDIMGYIESA